MRIKVHKYGGSSVADRAKIRHVARRVAATHRAGAATVVVVSAMGNTTEELLGLATDLSSRPSPRELDMLLSSGERISTALLALAIQELGIDAVSLTGGQGGILTSDQHFNAEIEAIEPHRILRELEAGRVVVVAGFQGVSEAGETTTLGRGGSDTSAVVLAHALRAERCEIFSDVEGVFTADPRIVDGARPLPALHHDEMLELARHGASVLNPTAVEHARDLGVNLRAASTFHESPGTLVSSNPHEGKTTQPVKGIACHKDLIRFSMSACPVLRGEVLEAGGRPDVYLDNASTDEERHDVLVRSDSIAHDDALGEILEREFGPRVAVETGIGSVSAVGRGVGTDDPHVAELRRMLGSTSPQHIATDHAHTFLVESGEVAQAARLVHRELIEPALGSGAFAP